MNNLQKILNEMSLSRRRKVSDEFTEDGSTNYNGLKVSANSAFTPFKRTTKKVCNEQQQKSFLKSIFRKRQRGHTM